MSSSENHSAHPVVRVPFLAVGSISYIRHHDLELPVVDFGRVVASPARGRRIANAYMAAPAFDPAAVAAYRAFCQETARQFEFLTASAASGGLGLQVEMSKLDPYPDAVTMTQDVFHHCRLRIYATASSGNGHPLMTNDENDMFRAVHDAFGHASIGRGFDRHGEEAAWLKHAHMYSPLARWAMTTETRGQNSTLIFQYAGRRFPEQKAALLPIEFSDIRDVSLHADSATR